MRSLLSFFLLVAFLSAQAQGPCDSLSFMDVTFDPIQSDSLVQVIVKNESSILFGYPSFSLVDDQGDTIAKETVNFFGLGNYYQLHSLALTENYSVSDITNGQLVLSSGFNNQSACVFDDDFQLCPDTCSNIEIYVAGWGLPEGYHEFDYMLYDDSNNTLTSGTFTIDSTQTVSVRDTQCLEPGTYHVEFEETVTVGSQIMSVRVDPIWGFTGVGQYNDTTFIRLDFDVMSACLEDSILGVSALSDQAELVWSQTAEDVSLFMENGAGDLTVEVRDLRGVLLSEHRGNGAVRIQTGHLPAAVYLITAKWSGEQQSQKFFIH